MSELFELLSFEFLSLRIYTGALCDRTLLSANPSLRDPDSLRVGSRISIPRDSSCYTSSPSTGRTTVSRVKASSVHRELSTRSTLSSFLLRPEIMSLSKELVLSGQVLSSNNREHRVGDGESLAWLAEKYGTTVNALKKLNNLKDDVIYSVSVLKIDRCSAELAVLGRKATLQERNASIDCESGNSLQPLKSVKPVMSACPWAQKAQRVHPIPRLETARVLYGDTLTDIASEHGRMMSSCIGEAVDTVAEDELIDVSVLVGRQGLSCDTTCSAKRLSCREDKLAAVNYCAELQKYINCNGLCIANSGPDHPAEMVSGAPKHMHPGACLYNNQASQLSCKGYHLLLVDSVPVHDQLDQLTHFHDIFK